MGFGQIQGAFKRDREELKEPKKNYLYRRLVFSLIKNAVIRKLWKALHRVVPFPGRREYVAALSL